ncbi:MAG: nucleoside deaminase [Cyclobacteriaceae bacterium]
MEGILGDEYFMREAMKLARQAEEEGEIPVGAVMVAGNRIIARAYNQTEKLNDPTAHAEMLAITSATHHLVTKYLTECSLDVTLEPCGMCAGALYWAQLKKLIYAAPDEKRGYLSLNKKLIHPRTTVMQGPFMEESSEMVSQFFRRLRK